MKKAASHWPSSKMRGQSYNGNCYILIFVAKPEKYRPPEMNTQLCIVETLFDTSILCHILLYSGFILI